MGKIRIAIGNGNLGAAIATEDGVVGMVLTGGIDGGGYVLGTPILITSLAALATAGITSDGNAFAVKEVTEFYTGAPIGAELYLMLVENTVTVQMMADNTFANGAKKLVDYAEGNIKVLGIMSDDTTVDVGAIANSLNPDVYTAADNMQIMAEAYAENDMPFAGIVAGTSFNSTAATLNDQTTNSNNRVGILIGDSVSGKGACLGLLLGQVAKLPVQRKISRVLNGKLPKLTNVTAFTGTTRVKDMGADLQVITDKGYITFTTYVGKTGVFFNEDPMCTATTDDFASLSNRRVIDKAHRITYLTYVEEVDNEILINDDGTLNAGAVKSLQQEVINQLNLTMKGNKEVSSVACFIDVAQDVLATKKLAVVTKVTPVGYLEEIDITLGFSNPAA